MPIQKVENVFLSLAVNATPIVNEKAGIEYLVNTTLQTGTAYVDSDTNNIVGNIVPNPAYQQPDEVVKKYLGDAMGSLVSAVEQEKAITKAAQDAVTAAAQAQADALASQSEANNAIVAARDATIAGQAKQVTALTQQVDRLTAEGDSAGAIIDKLKAQVLDLGVQLAGQMAKNTDLESVMGGTPAADARIKQKALDAIAAQEAKMIEDAKALAARKAELTGEVVGAQVAEAVKE